MRTDILALLYRLGILFNQARKFFDVETFAVVKEIFAHNLNARILGKRRSSFTVAFAVNAQPMISRVVVRAREGKVDNVGDARNFPFVEIGLELILF